MSHHWARWVTRMVGFLLAAFVLGTAFVQWFGVEPAEPDGLEMSDSEDSEDAEDGEQDLDEKMFGAPLVLMGARADTARSPWLHLPEPDWPAKDRLLRPPRA